MITASQKDELTELLKKRLDVIGDHAFRDRDPEAHLESLKNVSERITGMHAELKGSIPPRLDHFLTQCSFDKALQYLTDQM